MRLLEKTLAAPSADLALDEWLLRHADAGTDPSSILRIWERREYSVILGRGSKFADEVRADAPARDGIRVLRRCTGGASVVIGPGCLMYSLILPLHVRPECCSIRAIHEYVLQTMVDGFGRQGMAIVPCGISDLAVRTGNDLLKCGGNSLRRGRNHVLYHGTILYDFDLSIVSSCLTHPPREPDYRRGRAHESFLANLPYAREAIRQALVSAWQPRQALEDVDVESIQSLVNERYENPEWTYRF
jgi:lipoate-protein ligase A